MNKVLAKEKLLGRIHDWDLVLTFSESKSYFSGPRGTYI